MAFNPLEEKGIPLERQIRSWKEVAQKPYNKDLVDAFTRCRVILMNGIEVEATLFSHQFARHCSDLALKQQLAQIRYIEHQQQLTNNWLNPADQTVLETTIGYEQVAVELTAYLARQEPDSYVKDAFDFGLLEDFDHLYRYSQMLDLVEGKHPDSILQGLTEVLPGRPTQDHHNAAELRLLQHIDRQKADPITKMHILTLLAAEQQTNNFYRTAGNLYASPVLRQLYAEIGQVEEEHVSFYESLMDPTASWAERWLLHEFTEVANYYACYQTESDPRIKQIWELFMNFELAHLQIAATHFQTAEARDPVEVVGKGLPTPVKFESNKDYVANVLFNIVDQRLISGGKRMAMDKLPKDWPSYAVQQAVNLTGSPSETVVSMRMEAEGQELISAVESRAQRAASLRLDTLDAEKAPNTAPARGKQATGSQQVKTTSKR